MTERLEKQDLKEKASLLCRETEACKGLQLLKTKTSLNPVSSNINS